MKLYVKQKLTFLKEKFAVTDEQGNEKYYVQGEALSLGQKLHIYDLNNNEVGFIKEKLISFESQFYIYICGHEVGMIKKKITFFKPKYEVDYNGWRVEGDVMGWNYDVYEGNRVVATIRKKLMSWTDSYEVDIRQAEDELSALILVLAIDAVKSKENSSGVSVNFSS
ncbi:MAG: hypothetical protein E7262_01475 [Lachnospiraceae bacterium]|nr:hypothetical protein [Lachnospiraceae bacterium]